LNEGRTCPVYVGRAARLRCNAPRRPPPCGSRRERATARYGQVLNVKLLEFVWGV
jgi:hypothetical protein